ncbi:hypothetical protein [Chitinilyticum piscinae]|uniref:Lipoprotein n=1 Tax=Chitinilyticum piscinae TaxID=2866724 RepID=A0A8J7K8B6_9NEIS|nr:hypothetical protein [Chitinilyticum piscinae]MBE9609268.1 hypothetical protein [Chitinilyticum piscinae]
MRVARPDWPFPCHLLLITLLLALLQLLSGCGNPGDGRYYPEEPASAVASAPFTLNGVWFPAGSITFRYESSPADISHAYALQPVWLDGLSLIGLNNRADTELFLTHPQLVEGWPCLEKVTARLEEGKVHLAYCTLPTGTTVHGIPMAADTRVSHTDAASLVWRWEISWQSDGQGWRGSYFCGEQYTRMSALGLSHIAKFDMELDEQRQLNSISINYCEPRNGEWEQKQLSIDCLNAPETHPALCQRNNSASAPASATAKAGRQPD